MQQSRRLWGRPLHRRELLWRWMFEPPARENYALERWLELERAAPLTLAAPLESPPAALPTAASQVTIPSASEPPPRQPKVVQSVPVAPPVVPEKAKPAYTWDESAGID